MRIGLVYPQVEVAGDVDALHEIGVGAEQAGFDSLLMYDHVVGAEHAGREPALWGPYTERDPFHDPFVAFGYLAAVTTRIELATAVLILPQRQTVLVAQQAADVDLLARGRLRLGVGTGWNWVEYDALGQDFHTRGARLDEQIGFLRRLWTEPVVSFEGRFDRIERGCINPRPAAAVPVWVGGFGEAAFRRGGRLGDGFTFAGDVGSAIEGLARVRAHLTEAGRGADGFGTELILTRGRDAGDVVDAASRWRDAGGTAVAVVTMRLGFDRPGQHLDHAVAVKQALDAALG